MFFSICIQIFIHVYFIDSNAAWTEANVDYSLQTKERKTHLLFVFDLKIYRKMRLCVIIKKKTQSLLRSLGGLRAMNGLENIKYNFKAFIP